MTPINPIELEKNPITLEKALEGLQQTFAAGNFEYMCRNEQAALYRCVYRVFLDAKERLQQLKGGTTGKIKNGAFGILEKDGKVLLGKRDAIDTSFPDCWCHPGGGIEYSEPLDSALKREFLEEVLINVTIVEPYIRVHEWFGNGRHVILAFRQVASTEEPQCGDGFSEIGWFSLEQIHELASQGKTTPLTLIAAETWHNHKSLLTSPEPVTAMGGGAKSNRNPLHDSGCICAECDTTTPQYPQRGEVIETPRTNAQPKHWHYSSIVTSFSSVNSDFARQLERDLITAEKERDEFKKLLNCARYDRDRAWSDLDKLREKLSAAEKARDDYATEIYRLAEELRIRREKLQASNKDAIGPNQ